MRGDARLNENLTAVTDERQPPRGPPIEGLHLLISVVVSVVVALRSPLVCVSISSAASSFAFFSYNFFLPFLFVSFSFFF